MPQILNNNLALYNQLQGNTGIYGLGVPAPFFSTLSDEAISFNNFGLQNDTYQTIYKHEQAPDRDIVTSPAPRFSGEILTREDWRVKTITISGIIRTSTQQALEEAIDALKASLGAAEGNLDNDFAGKKRRYIATASQIKIDRDHYHIVWVPFEISFKCLTPFARDIEFEVSSGTGVFAESHGITGNNLGSTNADPVLIMVFTAANSVTGVNFKNNSNGDEIEISEIFSAGDFLIFDTIEKEVRKNGIPIDFDGFFPQLKTGSNDLEITVESTSHSYDYTFKFKNSYL